MNGWLIGLCVAVWFLATHAVINRIQFGNMLRVFDAFSEFLGAVGGIPEEKVNELKTTWAVQRERMRTSIMFTTFWWLAITVFVICLAIRGHV